MATDEKRCPTCGAAFGGGETFCQFDGAQLVVNTSAEPRFAPETPPQHSLWRRIPRETIAGLIVLTVIGTMLVAALMYRKAQIFRLNVVFEEGHELQIGDSVFVRGVSVGEVAAAEFQDGQFVARLQIDPDAASLLREESVFFIGYEKIATQKRCVHVMVVDSNSPPLKSGETVRGEDSTIKFYGRMVKTKGPKVATDLVMEMKSLLQEGVDSATGVFSSDEQER